MIGTTLAHDRIVERIDAAGGARLAAKTRPAWDPLRDHPRFHVLLDKSDMD